MNHVKTSSIALTASFVGALALSATAGTITCPAPQPGDFTQVLFTNSLGTDDCGGATRVDTEGVWHEGNPPFSGQLLDGSDTVIANLGLSCLYLGGGAAFNVPPGGNPDNATNTFAVAGVCPDGTLQLAPDAGTSDRDCTLGPLSTSSCIHTLPATTSCTQDADCVGGGTGSCAQDAACFFGTPLPIANAGLSTCVINAILDGVGGTIDPMTGDADIDMPLQSRVYLTGNGAQPCPTCVNDVCDPNWMTASPPTPSPNAGEACVSTAAAGVTHDCLPAGFFVGRIPVNLTPLTTGSTMLTSTDGMFCPGQVPTVGPGLYGAFGLLAARKIVETGAPAGDITGGPGSAILASTFCIPATGNGLIDGSADLPGPGATSLPGTMELVQATGSTTTTTVGSTTTTTLPEKYISGDGKGAPDLDCRIGLVGYAPEDLTPFGKKGKKQAIQCTDGDACDGDGTVNGTCVFSIGVRVNDPNVEGCAPLPFKKFKARAKTKGTKINFADIFQPAMDGSVDTSPMVEFPVLVKRFGKPKAKAGKGKVALLATKPKDKDKFLFVCNPASATTTTTITGTTTTTTIVGPCPNNASGGPRQLTMVVNGNGADLDNGVSGQSHNFPVPVGTSLTYCLSDCNDTDNPLCTATGPTGPGTMNGADFGPPLPLFSAGVPVCVINEYKESTIRGMANVDTGEFIAEQGGNPTPVVLNSRVFQCLSNQVCPRCTNGKCQGGARNGQSCTVDGTVVVNNPPAVFNDTYNLSNDCPPGGSTCSALGSIEVLLDLTTGTSMKAANANGTFPCPGQTQHDECQGSAECVVDCSPGGPSPTQDPKGGVSQFCCNDTPKTPCFPTSPAAGSMAIVRTGETAPPTPAWSTDPTTYPKTGAGVLAATFCEAATNSIAVNGTAGLPGPGALLLPGDTTWLGNQ